jgi:DNA-binding transcriptional LysR family regulator
MPSPPDERRLASRLRFRHLHLLLEIERGGSLRAAAQALHLTQPALSKALNEVESAFGHELFLRSARGLTPTARGSAALRGARQMLEDLGRLQRELTLAEEATIVRVGAPPFVAHGYLPQAIARLVRGPGRVHVELLEERVPVLLRALAAGEVDALVSSYPAQMPDDVGAALRFEKLFEVRFMVIAPARHALAKLPRVDWAVLAGHASVMPGSASMVRRLVDERFLRAGVPPSRPLVESTSPVSNVQMVAAGIGWSVVPEPIGRQAVAAGSVCAIKVRPALDEGPVALIFHEGHGDERVALLRAALRVLA